MTKQLEAQLRNADSWSLGENLFGVPSVRRWAFDLLLRGIERPIAPVAAMLVKEVDPRRIFRRQFGNLPGLRRLNAAARDARASRLTPVSAITIGATNQGLKAARIASLP